MAFHLPEIFVCILLAAFAAEAHFRTASAGQGLRGSDIIHVHELFHHHERHGGAGGRHQASTLLAVTDDAVGTAWRDQMHIPKEDTVDLCMGSRYMWMASMMKKCQQLFGPESHWSRDRMPFCKSGFQQCQPYYAQCCTQPDGAVTLEAYCDIRSKETHDRDDPACIVQTKIQMIQEAMAKIPDIANRILLSSPSSPLPVEPAVDHDEVNTASRVAADSYHDKEEDNDGSDPTTALMQDGARVEKTPPGGEWKRIFAPPTREVHCAEMSHVLKHMNEGFRDLTSWRASSAGGNYDAQSIASQDPALVHFVDNLVVAGKMLKQRANACSSASAAGEEGEDEEDAEEQRLLQSTVGADQNILVNEISGTNFNLVDTEMRTLRNRMNGYMGFMGYLNFHIAGIESKVHPHGDKWWRYRYEETLMEALFQIPFFAALIGLQHLMRHIAAEVDPPIDSPSLSSHSGWRGRVRISNFYRHLNISCMHNSVAVALMMFAIWGLNANTYVLDRFAVSARLTWEVCHDKTPDLCIFESVPFSGNAYYTMWTRIVMNLLGTCMLYSCCVWEFLRVSIDFLQRLKASEQSLSRGLPALQADAQELEQYLAFQEFFCERLARMQKSERLRSSARAIGLDLDKDLTQDDLKKVKFHRFLVVALDHASRDFVLWSPALLLTLVAWSFLVAFIAGHKKLSFAWFLPGILMTLFVLLALALVLKRALWTSTTTEKGEKGEASMPWLSARRWIIAVQIVLFMLCHSFAHLVLSKSIWVETSGLAFYSLMGFLFFIVLTRVCISDLMMRMVCVLSLPPNASTEVLEDYLEQMSAVAVDNKADS